MRIHLLIIILFGAITLSYSQTNKSAKEILLEHEEQVEKNEEFNSQVQSIIATPNETTFQSNVEEKNKPYVLPGESELGKKI